MALTSKNCFHTSEDPILKFSGEGKVQYLLCLGQGGQTPIKKSSAIAVI